MQEYDLYKAIERIRVRTGMYIREQTLANVSSYIYGYYAAMDDAGSEEVTRPSFEYFNTWLMVTFKFSSDMPGWVNMILALAVGCKPKKELPWKKMKKATKKDHLRSIELFFELIDRYKNDTDFAKEISKIKKSG